MFCAGKYVLTARVAKRAKVMFSHTCVTHSVQLQGGEVTPNASRDRSHGRGEKSCPGWVVLSRGEGVLSGKGE